MTDDEIEAALTEIPGIGPWTAHGFLTALDRPDVLLSGDLALRRAVQQAYGFDHPPTDDEMLELAERWRPYPKPRRELSVRVRIRRSIVMALTIPPRAKNVTVAPALWPSGVCSTAKT